MFQVTSLQCDIFMSNAVFVLLKAIWKHHHRLLYIYIYISISFFLREANECDGYHTAPQLAVHDCPSLSNYWQLHCLFNSLLMLMQQRNHQKMHPRPVYGESLLIKRLNRRYFPVYFFWMYGFCSWTSWTDVTFKANQDYHNTGPVDSLALNKW